MDDFRARARIISPLEPEDRSFLRAFLARAGLEPEDDIEATAIVMDGDEAVATASLAGDVVKCVAVLPGYEGEGAAARALSAIRAEAEARGRDRLFLYTKPSGAHLFESLGFRLLATATLDDGPAATAFPNPAPSSTIVPAEGAALLESDPRAFEAWAAGVARVLPGGKAAGAVVLNANPFTLGHRSLVERASRLAGEEGGLLVLVVAGDRSSFPGAVRERLVRAGTADLPGVTVASGGAYCVSGATFPAYYLREKSRAAELQAALDAELFASRIAPALGIGARLVGSEPYCPVTAAYNRALARILPHYGIELIELPRVELDGAAVSASEVRSALKAGDLERACRLVPATTGDWLRSAEAEPVIESIRAGSGRH